MHFFKYLVNLLLCRGFICGPTLQVKWSMCSSSISDGKQRCIHAMTSGLSIQYSILRMSSGFQPWSVGAGFDGNGTKEDSRIGKPGAYVCNLSPAYRQVKSVRKY